MPKKSESAHAAAPEVLSCNVAVLRGRCSRAADVKVLPSGQVLAELQVTTRATEHDKAVSVPVAVLDPPAWVEALDTGDEVVVLGRVRRRFFRAGGATASRVEIEAQTVARARDGRRVAAVRRRLDDAVAALEA